jgi:tRNA pseudouridine38-40 synthase
VSHLPETLPATLPARRLALVIEYDGTRYVGFQFQVGQLTIQGQVERALARFTGESIRIRAASRTDSGAHAKGQVVDFLTHSRYPVDHFPRALNFYLPADIRVQAAYEVAPEFHSRRHAISRTYRYSILNRCWPSPLRRYTYHWVKNPLDVTKMAAAAQSLVGSHDFRPLAVGMPQQDGGLSPSDRSTVRAVSRWDVWREDDTVIIECEANGFLRHQIRRANALLIEIGRGRWPEGTMNDVLHCKLTGEIEWSSVPARGLCLLKVTYPNSTPLSSSLCQRDNLSMSPLGEGDYRGHRSG